MARRLLVALAVAALLAALFPATGSAAERCSVRGAKVVLQNDQARVLGVAGRGEVKRTFYGCVRGAKPILLTRNVDPRSDEETQVSNTSFRLNGPAVAWVQEASSDFGAGEYGASVRGRVLRRGGVAFDVETTDTGTVENLAVRADGAAAWVAGSGRDYHEVDAVAAGARDPIAVAYARGIDPASLRIDDAGVRWTEGGTERTAPVTAADSRPPRGTGSPGPQMLDPRYGSCGVLSPPVAERTGTTATAIARGPSGAIVVAGGAPYGRDAASIALARLQPDGSLDPSFAGDGTLSAPSGQPRVTVTSVAVQPDEKIVVGGFTRPDESTAPKALLARFNPDGSPDAGFGAGGFVRDAFPGERGGEVRDIALAADGSIVTAGVRIAGNPNEPAEERFVVGRFRPDGAGDPAFGTAGVATVATEGGGSADAVALTGGRVVAGGRAGDGYVLVGLTAAGTLDPAFGDGGRSFASPPGRGTLRDLTILGDGRIVGVGTLANVRGRDQLAIARYDASGRPDASFGAGGFAADRHAFTPRTIAVAADGRLLVAANAYYELYTQAGGIVRYNADGTRDGAFGAAGALTSFGSYGVQSNALLVQPDGSVLAAQAANSRFAIARYAVDGPALAAVGDQPRVCSGSIATKSIRQLIRPGKRARHGKLRIVFRRAQPGPVRLSATVRVGGKSYLLGTGRSRTPTAGTSIAEIEVRPNVNRLLRRARSARLIVSIRGVQGGGGPTVTRTLRR